MRYLQAVFCGPGRRPQPIGVDVCREIRAHGYDGVRCDVQHVPPAHDDLIVQVRDEAVAAGLRVLLIVSDGRVIEHLGPSVDYELRNEPDLEGPTAETYRRLMRDTAQVALDRHATLYVGAISNLTARGLEYLRDLQPDLDALPDAVRVSIHWYPHRLDPRRAHPGFRTRLDEVRALEQVIGARRWAVTETGSHAARERH